MSLGLVVSNAAAVGMILAPLSLADDPSGVSTNPEPATTIPRLKVRLGQVPLGLNFAGATSRARCRSSWFTVSGDFQE